jgi:hypothetical protein
MTRKLAVTVFAMSLTLVGCGSSSTTKVDGGTDAKVSPAPDAGVKLDTANLAPDTGIVPPGDAGAADVLVAPDSGPVTDAVTLLPDGGTDTTSLTPDTSPAKPEGGADVQILPPDAAGSDGGTSLIPDAAKDVATTANPDVPVSGNPDVPASGVDVPPISPDAATEAGDVLVTVIPDASAADTSVTPDTATAVDVELAVDTIVAADVAGVDSGSTAADSGGSDTD